LDFFGLFKKLFEKLFNFKEPDVFNPDRYLDPQTGVFVPDEQVIPFSIGKRYCLGQSLAEKEFFLFFTGLMHKFEFSKVPGTNLPGYGVDEVEVKSILRTVPHFEVIIKERK
jgi:hypothetical protein